MRLSIVVPTRNRAELARRCVASALAAGHQDVQLLVLENSDRPEISGDDFGNDPRVTVLPSEKPLSMHANWERGLDVVDGDYVAYVSDKDVVLPGALGNAVKAIELVPTCQILAYRKPVYVVPTGEVTHYRASGRVGEYSTRDFLTRWYRVPQHYHEMPSIYGALVSRELIQKALAVHPKLFIGNSPDVASAAILCSLVDAWAGWEYQVTLGCYGPWSTGWATSRYGFLCESVRRFMRDYGRDIPAELGLPGVLATAVLEVLLEAQAKHPQTLGGYVINWHKLLRLLRSQLATLDVPESAKRSEWARLYTFSSVAPRSAVLRSDVEWAAQQVTDLLRGQLPSMVAGPAKPDTPSELDVSEQTQQAERHDIQSWFGHPPGSGTFSVTSVEDAVTELVNLNACCPSVAHLDPAAEQGHETAATGRRS